MKDFERKKKCASLRNGSKRILAQGVEVSNDTYETQCNNNDLVIGSTGSGKTRHYVKPNILSASESLVIADPKGTLHEEMGPALRDAGYDLLLLDMTDPEHSVGYEPLSYIGYDEATDKYDQNDIATVAEAIYGPTTSRDPYWDEAGKAMLRSCMSAVLEGVVKKDQNLYSVRKVFELIDAAGKGGNKSDYANLMRILRRKDPDSYAAGQYALAISERAETTASCVRMMLGNKLAFLQAKGIEEILLKKEQIDILQLARKKTALFVTISDMDRSQDMLANLFYTQAMQALCRYADKECEDYCLPVPVRFILDDFATNACIPDFDNKISVIRSRGIAVSIILQSQTQLEKMYGQAAAATILNGCDTILYLGGHDLATANLIGTQVNQMDHTVLTLPREHAWLIQSGQKPRLVKRYDLTSHPRYSLLPEAGDAAAAGKAADAKTAKAAALTREEKEGCGHEREV